MLIGCGGGGTTSSLTDVPVDPVVVTDKQLKGGQMWLSTLTDFNGYKMIYEVEEDGAFFPVFLDFIEVKRN